MISSLRIVVPMAAILCAVLHVQVEAQTKPDPTVPGEGPWMSLFDGHTMEQWGYVKENWHVDSGMIIGKSKSTYNNFCHSTKKYSDFVLAVRARLWETSTEYINSGIQYRSVYIDSTKHSLKGYQMDIGDGYNGSMYPEGGYPSGAGSVSPSAACRTEATAKQNQWCQYVITATGNKIRHEMNGILCAEYNATVTEGRIGLQLHFTTIVMEVDFKDIFVKPLNNSFTIPAAQQVTLNPDWTVKSATGIAAERNATIAFPPTLRGNVLTLPAFRAGDYRGRDGVLRISLSDASGRLEFSRSIIAGGELPLAIGLPNFGAGNHILRVGEGPTSYRGVVRSGD